MVGIAQDPPDAGEHQAPLVVIIGMHRSGTSALAGAMIGAGLKPPKRLMPARSDNPKGFWEPLHIVRLNNRLLANAGLAWDDPRPVPKAWLDSPDRSKDYEEAVNLLSLEFDSAATGVLKDPRISKLIPFWNKAFALGGYEAKYIICVRHPLEVASSLALRNTFDTNTSLRLWLSYMEDCIKGTSGHSRTVVCFEDVLKDAPRSVDRILRSLALPAEAYAAGSGSASIDVSLRHHACTKADRIVDSGSAIGALKLYGRFMKLRRN